MLPVTVNVPLMLLPTPELEPLKDIADSKLLHGVGEQGGFLRWRSCR